MNLFGRGFLHGPRCARPVPYGTGNVMTEPSHCIRVDGRTVETPRSTIRPWQLSDAKGALAIFGAEEVTRWLAPSVARITDEVGRRAQLRSWINLTEPPPVGHWAVLDRRSWRVIGAGQIVPLPPENRDLLVGLRSPPATGAPALEPKSVTRSRTTRSRRSGRHLRCRPNAERASTGGRGTHRNGVGG